jgi:transposase
MREPQEIEDEEHEQTWERVAAIDVAKASGMVCTRVAHPSRPGRRLTKVWEVPATTGAISELAGQLAGLGIQKVTVESTSDYWRPFVYLLQAGGLSVQLVNAREVKNVPGRPKTDRLDAVWLAKLTERGMLRPSFVPPAEIRRLRDYTRLRADLTQERARHYQRLEKLLEDALIKVSSVASKLDGLSVRDMLEALIAGERDPAVLAGLARGKLKAKHGALAEALAGRFDDHHAELARMLLDQIDALGGQIGTLTTRIEELLAAIPAADGVDADGTTGPGAGSGPDAVVLPAVARLDEVSGIGPGTAQVIIAEIGLDMDVFPTPGHLVSWAKLSPRTLQSGATRRAGKTGKGNPYLKGVLGEAAAAAGQDRHLPGRALPAPGQASRQAQGPGRHRPLHPGDRLASAGRPHRPLPRPGRRLLRQPHRQGQEGPQPHPAAASPGVRRHPHPSSSLTHPSNHIPTQTQSRLRRLLPPTQSGLRFSGQTLGWTIPRPRHPEQADRWTWLVLAGYTQLRLARDAVADRRLPWERPRPQPRLSPYRVRRGFPRLLYALGSPAAAPKPSGCSPGRPKGRYSGPATRHPAIKKPAKTPRKKPPRTAKAA